MSKLSLFGQLTKIDIESAISQTVELALPRFTNDKVLLCQLVLSAENFNTDHRICKIINLVIYRPNNYTFVGTCENSDIFFCNKDQTFNIEVESYHDSCWRDGISRIIRKTADLIDKQIVENEDDYHTYVNFGLLNYKFIKAKITNMNYNEIAVLQGLGE